MAGKQKAIHRVEERPWQLSRISRKFRPLMGRRGTIGEAHGRTLRGSHNGDGAGRCQIAQSAVDCGLWEPEQINHGSLARDD